MSDIVTITRRCPDCGETKLGSQFYSSRRTKDGLSTYCRPCTIERQKQSRERRKQRVGEEAYNALIARRQRERRRDPEKRAAADKVNRRVYRAMAELRDRHRDEYEAILARLAYEDSAS